MALAGIIPIAHYSGRVSLSCKDLTALFSRFGYVAQSAEDPLWDLSVEDVTALPLENRALQRAQIRDRVCTRLTRANRAPMLDKINLSLRAGEVLAVLPAAIKVIRALGLDLYVMLQKTPTMHLADALVQTRRR